MPSIEQIKEICTSTLRYSPKVVPCILGKPGMGKSDICIQTAKELGIPKERILVVHINNHEVVDFTGVPSVTDGMTKFNPTEMFYKFRTGTGKGMIVLEEVAQSSPHHQTWAAGFTLERSTATFELDDNVVIMVTGNRTEDKSGAKEMLRHFLDRVMVLEADDSLDDWCGWAIENDVPAKGVAFIRFRKELLNQFDPSQRKSPTQRGWTKLFKEVPMSLPNNLYLAAAEGIVGKGAAAEWVAAKDMMDKMPSVDAIRLNPESYELPKEPSIMYAVVTSMSMSVTDTGFDRDMKYIGRMSSEYQMVYVSDTLRRMPEMKQNPAFIQWAIANKDIFMGAN